MVNGDYDKARVSSPPARPGGARLAGATPRRGVGRVSAARAEPEDVDRPRAGPDGAQAVAHGLRRDALGLARAASRSSPSASRAASVEECVQPEPWAAPSA